MLLESTMRHLEHRCLDELFSDKPEDRDAIIKRRVDADFDGRKTDLAIAWPQWSPQNRPMVVTPKPANENAVRASHNITLAGVIRQGFLTTKAGRGPGRSPVKEPGSLPAQNAGERSVLGRRLARAVA
jgi:hypothetical protein